MAHAGGAGATARTTAVAVAVDDERGLDVLEVPCDVGEMLFVSFSVLDVLDEVVEDSSPRFVLDGGECDEGFSFGVLDVGLFREGADSSESVGGVVDEECDGCAVDESVSAAGDAGHDAVFLELDLAILVDGGEAEVGAVDCGPVVSFDVFDTVCPFLDDSTADPDDVVGFCAFELAWERDDLLPSWFLAGGWAGFSRGRFDDDVHGGSLGRRCSVCCVLGGDAAGLNSQRTMSFILKQWRKQRAFFQTWRRGMAMRLQRRESERQRRWPERRGRKG